MLGVNEYLSTSNTSSLNLLTDFSISLWYRPLQERNAGLYELLIGRGLDLEQWSLGLNECRADYFLWTDIAWEGQNDSDFDCGVSNSNNDWHHLVATYNNSTSTVALYKNGVLKEDSNSVLRNASHIKDLIIGNEYTGKIDNVIILNISLNQSKVDSLLNMSSCCD